MPILSTTTPAKNSGHWSRLFRVTSLFLLAALSSSCQIRQSEPTKIYFSLSTKIDSKEQQNTGSPNSKPDLEEQKDLTGVSRTSRFNVPELGGEVILVLFRTSEGASAGQEVQRILDIIRPNFPKSPFKAIVFQQERSGLLSLSASYVFMRRGDDFRQDASPTELSAVIQAQGNTRIGTIGK
jgi:hypothetical protein